MKLKILFLKGNEDMMVFPRHLSKLDRERIKQYVAGGFHWVRKNHGPRKGAKDVLPEGPENSNQQHPDPAQKASQEV